MSGIIEFADASNAVTGVVNEELIKTAMRNLWNQDLAEGTYYLFTNADGKEAIDAIYGDKYSYQHKETNFGLLVDSINTNYGTVNVVLS